MSRAQINMLEGSLVGPIFQFAIPVAMIGILQQMFNTADIMVLGRFVGTEALAAVGNNAPVIGVLVNLFLGISLGANVLIARKLGGGRLKEASEAIHTTVLMAGLTGLFILVVGEIFAGPLMGWMGVPLEVREASELYLRVYLLGMPGMTLYDFLSAIYRSHGNVRNAASFPCNGKYRQYCRQFAGCLFRVWPCRRCNRDRYRKLYQFGSLRVFCVMNMGCSIFIPCHPRPHGGHQGNPSRWCAGRYPGDGL